MKKLLSLFLLLCLGHAFAQVEDEVNDEDFILIPIEMTLNTVKNPSLKNLSIEELSLLTLGGFIHQSKSSSLIQTQVQATFSPYLRKQMMLSRDNYLIEGRILNVELKLNSVYNFNDEIVVMGEMRGRLGITRDSSYQQSTKLYSQNLQTYLEEYCGGCGITYPGDGSAYDVKISLGIGNGNQTIRAYYQYDQQESHKWNNLKRFRPTSFSEHTHFQRHTQGLELSQKLRFGEFFLRGETSYSKGQFQLFNYVDDEQEIETVEFDYAPTWRLRLKVNLDTKY